MALTYKGLNCIDDKSDPIFMAYKQQSQKKTPWTYQGHYAKVTIYFAAAAIFVATVKRIWFMYCDSRYMSSTRSVSTPLQSLVFVITAYVRLVSYRHMPSFLIEWLGVPASVGNFVFAVLTTIYLFCYCLIPHPWYRSCMGFGSPALAVRAGLMSLAITPFIMILSGKVNTISFFTGISYEKLNWVHQYTGLAALVLALIHTIPFIWQPLHEGGSSYLASTFTDDVYVTGIAPLVLLILLCLLFKRQIRSLIYEISFHLHWMMGIAYVALLGYHSYGMLNSENYIWATVAFWGFQWVWRIINKTFFVPGPGFLKAHEADLRLISSNMFEISVQGVNGLSWKPGQHMFLRFPHSRIFDSHPFSIASVNEGDTIRFAVVPKKGLTRKMHDELQQETAKKEKVILDGPYGGMCRNHRAFDCVFLLATGTGSTVTLSYLSSLVKERVSVVQEIHFVWIVRQKSDIIWAEDILNEAMDLASNKLKITIYVAGAEALQDSTSSLLEKILERKEIPAYRIIFQRPDMNTFMAELEPYLHGRNLFVSSGSDLLKRTVARSCAGFQRNIILGNMSLLFVEEVYLHTECFGW